MDVGGVVEGLWRKRTRTVARYPRSGVSVLLPLRRSTLEYAREYRYVHVVKLDHASMVLEY